MRIKYVALSLGIIASFGLAFLPVVNSAADNTPAPSTVFDACKDSTSPICANQDGTKIRENVQVIANTLLYILGAVAVVVIILGGISYVTSTGDPAAITKAKSSITYAVIGLVIALLAYAIVTYAIGIVKP